MPDRSEYLKEYYLKNKQRIKERNAKKYQENKEVILKRTSSYYHQNKEKRAAWKRVNKKRLAQYFSEYNKQHADVRKDRIRKQRFKKYQITEDEYQKLFIEQSGCCLGCGKHQDVLSKKLCVDHCHTTGKIRGLLCTRCNLAIGLTDDHPEVLLNLVAYLLKQQ